MKFKDYENMNFLQRREVACRYHLSRASTITSWHKLKNKFAKVFTRMFRAMPMKPDYYANYESGLSFYTGIDGAGKTAFTGENFNRDWNMRDILIQDLVLEVESDNREFNLEGTLAICARLEMLGIEFGAFDHGGRSFHIHLYNLFPEVQCWAEKEMLSALFALQVVPEKYYRHLDKALFGEHLIALEFSKHFRTGQMNRLFLFHTQEETCTQDKPKI